MKTRTALEQEAVRLQRAMRDTISTVKHEDLMHKLCMVNKALRELRKAGVLT